MSSRYAAARPKRAGEAFARAHHGEDDDPSSTKKVKFDVRNPSALAPSAGDDDGEADDGVLAADVIGGGGRATKRGAVNIDGYDSDSENETFNVRAEARGKKGKEAEDVDLAEVMDNYNSKGGGAVDEDDDEVDMFGDDDEDEDKPAGKGKGAKKGKEVRFLDEDEIEGQEYGSKTGGTVKIDDDGSSDDEDIEAAIAEEAVDEEVGMGGLKKHAPKIDAFNMRQENEEGVFDEAGNYIRKAADADAVHDRWLEGLSKKEIKKAAEAQEKRDAEQRQKQREDDSILTGDLLKSLILRLELGETALEALARLGKGLTKPKKVPKWKQKKAKNGGEAMEVDTEKEAEDPKQVKIKQTIDEITDAADKLLGRDYPNVYDTERERLVRIFRNETGEDWVEPRAEEDEETEAPPENSMWEFRWVDGRDDAEKQGPFDGPTMKAWQDAGYFGEGVEFRPAGKENGWTRVATFV
ncbi:LIN1-like protein [Podospora aff. communis PSN243]|uniref:LIN1-like protein n=1 Tax=Podospora aff. communis PSN243 TaxID=3040156 RepID=A0AAV9H4M0_9PEZI|nr:LIN1-like protein [Podospora aff. communis PSN243]